MQRALRIALATGSDGMGGAETMMMHLADGLRARGHHVEFIGPTAGSGWLGGQLRERGFVTHALTLGRVRWTPVKEIRHAVSKIRADVLHSHMMALAMFGTAATTRSGVPHVITMHGTGHETSAARRRWMLRGALRASDASVAVSDGLKHELRTILGPVADRMHVLPNGVPERDGMRDCARAALGVAQHELLVVAVGNLFHNKAHATLLDALARVPTDVPWRLAIAGRREEATAHLEAQIAARGWQQRVQLLGPRSDVPDLLAAADVYAMPSLNEALPMALLEAMFAAKAIVASAVGGIPEAVRSEREGLLVPPGNPAALGAALERLLSSTNLREQLGARARERARETYGVVRMVTAHESLYYEVAARHRRPVRVDG